MSEFTYENQGTNTYLVYKIGEKDVIDTMSLGMLTNNNIPGLATATFVQMDAEKYIKYNVSSKISVKQFFAGVVNRKRIVGVFSGIVDALLSAEDYMIDPATVLLDMDYMYADVSSCKTVLICVPVEQAGEQVDLRDLFRKVVFTTQFDQTENNDYVAKILNYLNSTPIFSLTDFKEVLLEIERGSRATISSKPVIPPMPVQPAVPVTPRPMAPQQPMPPQQQAPIAKPVPVAPPVPSAQKPPMPIPNAPNSAMAIPNASTAPAGAAAASGTNVASDGQDISLMYLLQHYNKENAAAYKAQKEAKKGKPATPQVPATPIAQPATQAAPGFGFAVPGQAPVATPAAKPAVAPAPAAARPPMPPAQPAQAAPAPVYMPPAPVMQGQAANFGETTVLGGGSVGETTVLGAVPTAAQARPHLIRMKNNEKIHLNKNVFRIGKEKSFVDYFIGDNPAISRSHATILVKDGVCFVVDTNSTNHTYVNGTMSPSNAETKLSQGDKIRFANEEFEFRMI